MEFPVKEKVKSASSLSKLKYELKKSIIDSYKYFPKKYYHIIFLPYTVI